MDRTISFLKQQRRHTWIVAMIVIGALWQAVPTQAAGHEQVLFIGPVGQVRVGESLTVDVQLDSDGQRINAADLTIKYDPAALTVDRVARERSMFTLWPEEPSWESATGSIHITGGRPGGLYAVHGLVATIYFTVGRGGSTPITLEPGSSAYLNDNAGTAVRLSATPLELNLASDLLDSLTLTSPTHPTPTSWSRTGRIVVRWTPEASKEYSYQLSNDSQAVPDETLDAATGELTYDALDDGVYYFTIKERVIQGPWQPIVQRRFLIDGTPPAAFTIEKLAPAEVENNNVISWGTVDTTSGVVKSVLAVDGQTIGPVTSPLTLQSDWLGKQITVTVVDAAGNIRSGVWPAGLTKPSTRISWLTALIVAVMVGLALAFFRRFKPFR